MIYRDQRDNTGNNMYLLYVANFNSVPAKSLEKTHSTGVVKGDFQGDRTLVTPHSLSLVFKYLLIG